MKTSDTSIFQLIGRLSANEKRYFKLEIDRFQQGVNRYGWLFEEISRQGIIDDKYYQSAFLQRFPQTDYFKTKQYLYKRLLNSLIQHSKKKHIEIQLDQILASATILKDKLLWKSAHQKLKHGLKLAEKHGYTVECIRFYREIMTLQNILGSPPTLVQQTRQSMLEALQYVQDDTDARQAYNQQLEIYHKPFSEEAKRKTETLESQMRTLGKRSNTLQLRSQSYWAYWAFYALNSSDHDLAYRMFLKRYCIQRRHMESTKAIQVNVLNHLTTLFNATKAALSCGYIKSAGYRMQQLQKTIDQPFVQDFSIARRAGQYFHFTVRIEWLLEQKRLQDCIDQVFNHPDYQNIQPGLRSWDMLMLKLKEAELYFVLGDYEKSHDRLNELLNDKNLKNHPEFIPWSEILEVLIQLEQREFQVAQSLFNRHLRNQRKRKSQLPDQKILQNAIRVLLKEVITHKRKQRLLSLLEQSKELESDPKWRSNLRVAFKTSTWIQSKVQGVRFYTSWRNS